MVKTNFELLAWEFATIKKRYCKNEKKRRKISVKWIHILKRLEKD